MNAARPDRPSAEPILLTEAALEHALDVFLPEDPEAATVATDVRMRGADPAEDFFVSETQEDERNDLPIRTTPESQRPWRTYLPPTETESVSALAPSTNPVATPLQRLIRTGAIAAGVAIGLAAIGSIAIQPRLNRTPAVLEADIQPAPTGPPLLVPAGRASEVAAAVPFAAVVDARSQVGREAHVTSVLAPVTGAVLKGSLTPDPKPGRAVGSTVPAPRDAARATLPIEASAASGAYAPALSTSPERPPEPAPLPPVEPAPGPYPPSAVRDAAPAARESLPAPPATAVESPVPTVAADTASIEAVLSRYRHAYTALDANAARAVWPGVDARALGRAFDQLVEQQLDFQNCSIVVNTVHATAACGGRARYVPKVGSRSLRDEPRQWTFSLQKVNGQWLIERVASR